MSALQSRRQLGTQLVFYNDLHSRDAVCFDHDERIGTLTGLDGAHALLWGRSLVLSTVLDRKIGIEARDPTGTRGPETERESLNLTRFLLAFAIGILGPGIFFGLGDSMLTIATAVARVYAGLRRQTQPGASAREDGTAPIPSRGVCWVERNRYDCRRADPPSRRVRHNLGRRECRYLVLDLVFVLLGCATKDLINVPIGSGQTGPSNVGCHLQLHHRLGLLRLRPRTASPNPPPRARPSGGRMHAGLVIIIPLVLVEWLGASTLGPVNVLYDYNGVSTGGARELSRTTQTSLAWFTVASWPIIGYYQRLLEQHSISVVHGWLASPSQRVFIIIMAIYIPTAGTHSSPSLEGCMTVLGYYSPYSSSSYSSSTSSFSARPTGRGTV
ncbi:Cytosine-purine permease [Mycena sanguinolenta]|uniref:Cytosine-purine permease n=1 Tax=Mycena sanguinolenta TaxID=230812 RepID=A0A8H6WY38_9AGAR|nr:Cytosine-purine permease [Mycena sanguinolenta]